MLHGTAIQSAFVTTAPLQQMGSQAAQDDGEQEGEEDDQDPMGLGKRGWTQEEDNLLLRCVQAFGPRRWASAIAPNVPGRTGKQCRDRCAASVLRRTASPSRSGRMLRSA
jgi:hypothetical protein